MYVCTYTCILKTQRKKERRQSNTTYVTQHNTRLETTQKKSCIGGLTCTRSLPHARLDVLPMNDATVPYRYFTYNHVSMYNVPIHYV